MIGLSRSLLLLFFILSLPLVATPTVKTKAKTPSLTLDKVFEPHSKKRKHPKGNSKNHRSNPQYTFIGADDAINHVEFCQASDNTCSSCLWSVYSVEAGSTTLPYSSGGTTYAMSTAAITSYLNWASATEGTYYVGMKVRSQSLNCGNPIASCIGEKDSESHALCLTATFNGSAVTSLVQNDNGNVTLDVPATSKMLVADSDNGNVWFCDFIANDPNSCLITPSVSAPAWTPKGVAYGTVNGTSYGYVADTSGNVYQCSLNLNYSFSSCTPTPSVSAPTWHPTKVNLAWVYGSQYAYVVDPAGSVYRCTLNSDGTFNSCATTPDIVTAGMGANRYQV